MIDGASICVLRRIPDDRGDVMHMLRADSPMFEAFGEVYFSRIKCGAVKAWRRHLRMTCNLAVPVGEVRLVLFDEREGAPTRGAVDQLELGAANYRLVRIPPGVWYGFCGLSEGESLIANCATLPHDPAEIERLPPDATRIPYSWGRPAPNETGID